MADSQEYATKLFQYFSDSTVHPYLRVWYGWKLLSLQALPAAIDRTALLTTYQSLRTESHPTLSPYVSKCMSLPDVPSSALGDALPYCLPSGLFQWEYFTVKNLTESISNASEAVPDALELTENEKSFLAAAAKIKTCAITIHAALKQHSREQLVQMYGKHLEIFDCYQAVIDLFCGPFTCLIASCLGSHQYLL